MLYTVISHVSSLQDMSTVRPRYKKKKILLLGREVGYMEIHTYVGKKYTIFGIIHPWRILICISNNACLVLKPEGGLWGRRWWGAYVWNTTRIDIYESRGGEREREAENGTESRDEAEPANFIISQRIFRVWKSGNVADEKWKWARGLIADWTGTRTAGHPGNQFAVCSPYISVW